MKIILVKRNLNHEKEWAFTDNEYENLILDKFP